MNDKIKISIGCDHAAYEYKVQIVEHLEKEGYEITDHGTSSADSVDYPDHAHPVAQNVANKDNDIGILLCGSANGVAMTANKYNNVRAAICWTKEITMLARQHNDANIICIPARFISFEEALSFVQLFLNTEFEGGRHQTRVSKIPNDPFC